MVCLAVLIIGLSAVLSGCLYVHKIAHVVLRQSDRKARKGLNVQKRFFFLFCVCACTYVWENVAHSGTRAIQRELIRNSR